MDTNRNFVDVEFPSPPLRDRRKLINQSRRDISPIALAGRKERERERRLRENVDTSVSGRAESKAEKGENPRRVGALRWPTCSVVNIQGQFIRVYAKIDRNGRYFIQTEFDRIIRE